jgi:hypothetical protein
MKSGAQESGPITSWLTAGLRRLLANQSKERNGRLTGLSEENRNFFQDKVNEDILADIQG